MNVGKAHGEIILKNITREALESKKPVSFARPQTPEIQIPELLPSEDKVDISEEAKKKADDFQKMLEKMRSDMRALREGLKQAREAGEGAAEAWKERIKCLQIAMRIMSGDKVPEEDHRYLREKDMEMYSRAISLRIEKKDPKEYDRLSEDEKKRRDNSVDDRADAASSIAAVPPAQTAAQPAVAQPPEAAAPPA